MTKSSAPPASRGASAGGAGSGSELSPAVVVLRHPIEVEGRILAKIELSLPTAGDFSQLSPDLVARRRDTDQAMTIAFDRALTLQWLTRLSGLPVETLRRISLDDGASLIEALSILLARATYTVMRKN